jgi:hypothetical protein
MIDSSRQFKALLQKKIIKDEILGTLVYEEYQTDGTCNFDKNNNICDISFYDLEIKMNGDVHFCCPGWNPSCIGNILDESLESLWNGLKAETVRNSFLDGSYRYCNEKTCPSMIAGEGHRIIPKEKFKDPKLKLPRNVAFSIDNTCNLVCPSCRTEKIIVQDTHYNQRSLTILRNVFAGLFSESHDHETILTFDGLGEIFFSPVYREIFETEEVFKAPEKWPNLKFVLCTNGTMMTEKIQTRYKSLFDQSIGIRISIDAGNKESYEKVRCGGDWDLLLENMKYLYSNTLTEPNNKCVWTWNVILQKNNYESLPNLIELAYQFPDKLPDIYIVNMLNWGTLSPKEFNEQAVWLPSSSRHEDVKRVLNLDIVKNYPRIFLPQL